jgi:aminoglycoside phosphotransferase (APT) family kinase protein
MEGLDEVHGWLDRHPPSSFRPGIVHGDFHLANMMFSHDEPALAAIVDWELASIGEPLLDLGWLLATWPDAQGRSVTGSLEIHPHAGLPTQAELIARYAALSGRDVSDLSWWAVLACYKLGILLEGTHARACAGKAPADVGAQLHAAALALFDRARARIAHAD